MKTSKIRIRNLLGIKEEINLNGNSVEITGKKGTGKTSVLDAIRLCLENRIERDYIIHNGETEGEILIETDTGLSVDRRKRTNTADYFNIKDNGKLVPSPQSFLNEIFTPLQLNPVAFTQMPKQEQNRMILDLIIFDWDMKWIAEQFGEIPPEIDYGQNILQVLNDIQADDGAYYKARQIINSAMLHNKKTITDIGAVIPEGYQAEKWETYNLGVKYQELAAIRAENSKIERAKIFKDSYDNKIRGYDGEKLGAIAAAEQAVSFERGELQKNIERMKAEIEAAETAISGLESKKADKVKIIESEHETKVAILAGDIQIANQYIDKTITPVEDLTAELATAETMKEHLNEFKRMKTTQAENVQLDLQSKEYTRKIELARSLPGVILQTATIPVEGLTVKDGIPLVNGLPVSNLSDGEKLELCVDVTIGKENALKLILIDGAEKLDSFSREALYQKCFEKGLQFIATRVTDSDELEIVEK